MSTASSEPRNWALERAQQKEEEQKEFEAVETFHRFLQGQIPKGVIIRPKLRKMNADQAMAVIWFLQECCHLIDVRFEMCHTCKVIYNSHAEGAYVEKTGHCYCDSCYPGPY